MVFGTNTADRASWLVTALNMPGTEERTAISVSYRLQGTLEHKVLRQIFVSTVT